jgi:hypothetical protein
MAQPANIITLNPEDFSIEVYSNADEGLIPSVIEENEFNIDTDYVEFVSYDLNDTQVYPGGNDLTYTGYTLLDNEIYVDPEKDLQRGNIDTGKINVLYNFLRKRLSSSPQSTYYIKEISSDRTEIRLDSNVIPKTRIIASTNEFIDYRKTDNTFPDFYLNFGSNNLYIANNIVLDDDNTVLIKLYEPLSNSIPLKTSLWVVEKISNGVAYRVEFNNIITLPSTNIQIQGPNLNLAIKNELNNSSENTDLSSYTSPNSQSEYQINSYFDDPSININVDYTDFSNFVNFSSARGRLENFWYKVSLIESASIEITNQSSTTSNSYVSSSISHLNQIVKDTITNFDKYEYYLYFESSSDTYPKLNTEPPYENSSTGSVAAIDWYENKLIEADNYDEFNYNWLKYSTPDYIKDDSSNAQYLTFLNMVGHFIDDNVWIYVKDTTNKWDADNRINAGVSKDLVAQVLRDLGVKLYQNNYSSGDLYSAFLGFTDSGSLFPYPYMTGSVETGGLLDTPQGYEYITNFISSSDEAIPLDDINKRIYKRIYHNLPYLLKSKGTVAGLRTLITSYGIPDTILRISEFGGKDKINVNDWDLWKHQYNYQYNNLGANNIETAWRLKGDWGSLSDRPETVQFRFNAGNYSSSLGIAPASQSLWALNSEQVSVVLEYNQDLADIPSADTYSGSILNPEYQYGTLKFTIDNFGTSNSASIYLPFFNNDWWSVQVNRSSREEWELIVGNKIYSGSDGSKIGFIASSSFTNANYSNWENDKASFFPLTVGTYQAFSGSYQEIRYFAQALSQSVFKDYVMNPQSTEGNGINGSYTQLAFRAPLGGELYTGSLSVHPKSSGNYITESFFPSSSIFSINGGEFRTNREWVFYDSPAVGIKNRNTDKIKQQELILPSGDTLSNIGSIQQKSYTTQDYTNNLNLLEVAFSPQNQINDDIIGQIGYFNIGDYIGDPRLISSSANTYPSLVELSKEYFDKYSSSYDVYDYIRLIKFFDNSLFKMIKDYVPVRTGLASGIVVKQHLLERQKYPTPQASWTQPEYTGSIGSIPSLDDEDARYYQASTDFESFPIETISGSDGGAFLTSSVTQSWEADHITPFGNITYTQDNKEEFYDGEFSGSVITATTQSLNPGCNIYKEADTTVIEYTGTSQAKTYNIEGNTGGATGMSLGAFMNKNYGLPSSFDIWMRANREIVPPNPLALPYNIVDTYAIERINIKKISSNSIDLTDYIPTARKIKVKLASALPQTPIVSPGPVTITDNLGTEFEVEVVDIKEYIDYYSLQIKRDETIGFKVNFQIVSSPLGTLGVLAFSNFTGPYMAVLNPYIPTIFQNSNCNPLINNATDITPSIIYYDVDYANNPNVAVNFDAILSGSAPKAKIQDYNYFARRSIIPRYEGSRNTSFEYNVDNGAIDATQAYFAYFNWVGGTSPEWGNGLEDRSAVNVRFFVDREGTIIKPINDSQGINQGIVEQNFTEDKIATLAFDDSTGVSAAFTNLLGDHTIFKSGKTITPIIYSQTESIASGSNGGYLTTLTFVQGDQQQSSAGDYRLTAFNQGDTIVTTGKIDYQNVTIQGAKATWTSDNTYSPQTTNPTADGVTLYFTATLKRVGGPVNKQVTLRWYKNGSPVGSPQSFDFNNPYYNNVSISYTDATATTSDDYDVRITTISGTGILELSLDSYIQVSQTPVPNIGNATSPFWETTLTDNIIRTTTGFTAFYGQKQEDIKDSGFFNITNDFELQVGDEIRFEGTETQAYIINEVYAGAGGKIHLVLDRDVTATNLQWFLVRRYVDDPASIILEVDKTAGGTSPGVLKPQYLSRDVENNIDIILEKLKTDQLI